MCADHRRNDREAYLFGVPSIDAGALPRPQSAVFPVAGIATLRAPSGDLTEIVKFGPWGGSHGHFDKLNEVLFAKGVVMSVDPGTQRYGVPTHLTWDRMTVAHNTVGVDERAQTPATGRLISWQSEPDFTAVTADAGPAYADAQLRRTSMVTSDYVLEITTGHATDGKEHDFDLSYHNYGTEHPDGVFQPYSGFPQRDGYQILSANQVARLAGDFHTVFAMEEGRSMNAWVLGDGQEHEVFTGLGLGPELVHKVPYFIVRHRGLDTVFVTVLQPGPTATPLQSLRRDGKGITIRSAAWEDRIELGPTLSYHRTALP